MDSDPAPSCSWLWRHPGPGQPGPGLCQLHGAPAADAETAHVQSRDAVTDHGEPPGPRYDVKPRPDAPHDHGKPPDATADGEEPRDQPHAQQPGAHEAGGCEKAGGGRTLASAMLFAHSFVCSVEQVCFEHLM